MEVVYPRTRTKNAVSFARATHTIRAVSAKRYVIGVRHSTERHKLFQIAFGRDGSLYASFPYYNSGPGQIGYLRIAAGAGNGETGTFGPESLATAHYVKYAHHKSGRAHFSLTGKVRSDVGKQSVPLAQLDGHVFTVMLQGFRQFDPAAPPEPWNAKRGVVLFPFSDSPVAVKFVGSIYRATTLAPMVEFSEQSQWMKVVGDDGKARIGILLDTPVSDGEEQRFLMLTAEPMAQVNSQQDVLITFLGGFDPPDLAYDHSRSTALLMFIYPSPSSFEQLRAGLGTADTDLSESRRVLS